MQSRLTINCGNKRNIHLGCFLQHGRSNKLTKIDRSRKQRLGVVAVIPMLSGDATEQTPPDLPSYLFKERIVYLGMSLVPSVTELLLAELLYLQYDNPTKPIYMYINSAGVIKGGPKLGYESETFAIYDTMAYIKPPIHTICVGTAYGESALLLASGQPGKRGSLPSASIMLRQPMQRFQQMQASDIDIYRNEMRKTREEIERLLAKHTGQSQEKISKDLIRPKYFDPWEAKDYGIIDNVLEPQDVVTQAVIARVKGESIFKK
eukprot:TRINITY_DN2813_c0_g1_i1.p1 TRINITY_DN2813_c0_g1~~TRINITY_DN2813_c0_g1_i1.p1  ORF type:complete len:299 (+),score=13.43 TRINITY_DN2813_c0_g1_i1:109-897(+)